MLGSDDVSLLACPGCRRGLRFKGYTSNGFLHNGLLLCVSCGATWPVRNGLAKLYDESALSLKERLIRRSYDKYGRFHEPLVRFIFPLLKEETAEANRERYLARLDLLALAPRSDRQPTRILEVGVGSGDDLPVVRRRIRADVNLEIWGVDVSLGMLQVLRPKLLPDGFATTKILMGDAHALPFADHVFDRVFHVGAANSYRNPREALREMARVSRPGSPIVVVDEWLDDSRTPRLRDRILFQALTPYDWNLSHPLSLLPADVEGVTMEQLNPVFYCLSFRTRATL